MKKLFCCHKTKDDVESIVELDFSHKSLVDVPAEVFQNERTLERLDLSSNRIVDLPRELFFCQELRHLDISNNELNAIPVAISQMLNVERIDLSRNSLKTLPPTIKSCKSMTSLDLSCNNLEKIPDAITTLITLQELYLNDSLLEFLPANFGRLVKLKVLELRNNQLVTLPKSMTRLVHLERLDIGSNEFTELPEVVGQLPSLTELWIDCNKIRRMSTNIGQLKKLMHFDGSKNMLSELPSEFTNLSRLTVLELSHNDLETLPENLGALTSLVTLKVESNTLIDVPESLCKLTNMEELYFNDNSILSLPDKIGQLRKLKYLNVDCNLLHSLPADLCGCTALTTLSVKANKLTELPENIGYLSNLRVLDIIDNRINALPISLAQIKNLSAIWISKFQSNPLVNVHQEVDQNGVPFLTNFLLPQVDESHMDERCRDNVRQHSPLPAVDRQKRICFASDPAKTVKNNGQLLRSPTPYPNELKLMAKYVAKNRTTNRKIEFEETPQDAEINSVQLLTEDYVHPSIPPNAQTCHDVREARVTSSASKTSNPNLLETDSLLRIATNQPHHSVSYYSQSFYSELNGSETQSIGHDSFMNAPATYATRSELFPNEHHLQNKSVTPVPSPLTVINRAPSPVYGIKQPPPYEIAKFYTKKSEQDLLDYHTAGSQNGHDGSNVDTISRRSVYGDEVDGMEHNNMQYLTIERSSMQRQERSQSPVQYQDRPRSPYRMNHDRGINATPQLYAQQEMNELIMHKDHNSQYEQSPTQYRKNDPQNIQLGQYPNGQYQHQVVNNQFINQSLDPRLPTSHYNGQSATQINSRPTDTFTHHSQYLPARNATPTQYQEQILNAAPAHLTYQVTTSMPQYISQQERATSLTPAQLISAQQHRQSNELMNSNKLTDVNEINRNNQMQVSTDSGDSLNNRQPLWRFGLHKNPRVIELTACPSEFSVTEFPEQAGIYVSHVHNNNCDIQAMDKLLDVDGVDVTTMALSDVQQILTERIGPTIIMVSRK